MLRVPDAPADRSVRPWARRLTFGAAGAIAIAVQVTLLRELIVSLSGDESAVGIGLAAWLAGIAAGAAAGARLLRRPAAGVFRAAALAGPDCSGTRPEAAGLEAPVSVSGQSAAGAEPCCSGSGPVVVGGGSLHPESRPSASERGAAVSGGVLPRHMGAGSAPLRAGRQSVRPDLWAAWSFGLLALSGPCLVAGGRFLRLAAAPAPGELLATGSSILLALAVLAPPGALVGVLFIALAAAAAGSGMAPGRGIASLYIFESLGSLAAGLAMTLVVIPNMPPLRGISFVGALCILAALPATFALRPRPASHRDVPCPPEEGSEASEVPGNLGAAHARLSGRNEKRAVERADAAGLESGAHALLPGRALLLALAGALLTLVLTPAGGAIEEASERARFRGIAPGIPLLAWTETPYQHVEIGGGPDLMHVYTGGQYAGSFPDPASNETLAHTLACLASHPARVLAIGLVAQGPLRFLLRHPVERIDVLEPDAKFLALLAEHLPPEDAAALGDPRVRIVADDPRRFLSRSSARYELILVLEPDPITLLLARTTTEEFYRLAASRLAPDGTLVVSLRTAPNVITGETASMAGSIFGALRSAFPAVTASPGPEGFLVAGFRPEAATLDPDILAARWRARGLSSPVFAPEMFAVLFPPERVREQHDALARAAASVTPSSDERPVSFLYALARRETIMGGVASRSLAGLARASRPVLVLLLFAPSCLLLLWMIALRWHALEVRGRTDAGPGRDTGAGAASRATADVGASSGPGGRGGENRTGSGPVRETGATAAPCPGAPLRTTIAGARVVERSVDEAPQPRETRSSLRSALPVTAAHATLITGACGITWSLLLLLSYQTRVGALYGQIGLLTAIFMLGLAIGGAIASFALPRAEHAGSGRLRRLSAATGDGSVPDERSCAPALALSPQSVLARRALLAACASAFLFALLLPLLLRLPIVEGTATGFGFAQMFYGGLLLLSGMATGTIFPIAAGALLVADGESTGQVSWRDADFAAKGATRCAGNGETASAAQSVALRAGASTGDADLASSSPARASGASDTEFSAGGATHVAGGGDARVPSESATNGAHTTHVADAGDAPLPLASAAQGRRAANAARAAGAIEAADHAGAAVAAICAALIVVPLFGVGGTALLMAGLQALALAAVAITPRSPGSHARNPGTPRP